MQQFFYFIRIRMKTPLKKCDLILTKHNKNITGLTGPLRQYNQTQFVINK